MTAVRGRSESATLCAVSYQQPVSQTQVPCTPYQPPDRTGVVVWPQGPGSRDEIAPVGPLHGCAGCAHGEGIFIHSVCIYV
jgi:hypothetical protein